MKFLYKVLELDENATAEDIKKQYKKIALKSHPDKGGDQNKFAQISLAKDILSDPKKRQQYDQGLIGDDGKEKKEIDLTDLLSGLFGNGGEHDPYG